MRTALQTVGFFYISNYGITEEEEQSYLNLSRKFFNRPLEEKRKLIGTGIVGTNGYVAIGRENLDDYDPELKDTKEAMDFCVHEPHPLYSINQWPDESILPKWKENIKKFLEKTQQISWVMVRAFALAMGETEDFLYNWYTHNSSAVLRFLRYPPRQESNKYIGAGAHSDYGILTMLLQDDIGGLQILHKNGKWTDVVPKKGTLVINVGDCMEFLTNGSFKATKHRVINNSTTKDRYVVVLFCDPSVEMPITCARGFLNTNDPFTNRPKNFGEHLQKRLTETYNGINMLT